MRTETEAATKTTESTDTGTVAASAPAAAPTAVKDVVLLVTRVVLGIVFLAHGLDKMSQGVPATGAGFGQMGIPLPDVAAAFAILAEVGGGALLLLGLLTPIAALMPVIVMIGAFITHAGNGVFVTDGGWELTAALGVGALLVAATGPGRLSVDGLIARARAI